MQLDAAPASVHTPVTIEEAKSALSTGYWADDSALKIVLADTVRAENFSTTKSFFAGWVFASSLYQSPYTPRYWNPNGGGPERASINFFTVASCTNALVPQIINGLFYENPPFMVQQRPGTTAVAARAVGALLGFQLEDINFKEELRLGSQNAVLFGTALWKWGWETFTRERLIYARKSNPLSLKNPLGGDPVEISDDDDIEEQIVEEYVDRPFFEHIVNLRHVLVDPGLNVPDVRKAKYAIHRLYVTWDELDKLRDRPDYNIPSREKLLELFFPPKEPVAAEGAETATRTSLADLRAEPRYVETTEDPFEKPLELLERWDGKKVIVVLQKKLVICNSDNPYGVIPFFSIGWWDCPESFYSMGLAKTVGTEQRLQQGITNAVVDEASLNLNGVYVRVLGKNVPTQNIGISPGKIINVEDKDGFKPLDRLPAVPEAGEILAMSTQRAEQISGVPGLSQGQAGSGGHSNIARSSAGAQGLMQGATAQPAEFVEKLANQVIIPFLNNAASMNQSLLPTSTWKYILGEELQHEYMKTKWDIVELLNARVKFSILAGAKMQVRRNISQALPVLLQFLQSPEITQAMAIQGKKVDFEEMLKVFFDMAGMASEVYSVIKPMNQQEQQRWQQTQPAAQVQAKAQAQSQQMERQFEQKQQLLEDQTIGRATNQVIRHAIETSVTPEVLTGSPGASSGFGSSA